MARMCVRVSSLSGARQRSFELFCPDSSEPGRPERAWIEILLNDPSVHVHRLVDTSLEKIAGHTAAKNVSHERLEHAVARCRQSQRVEHGDSLAPGAGRKTQSWVA